jgi:hypothetical protein
MFKKIKQFLSVNQKLVITTILSVTALAFFISSRPSEEINTKAPQQMLSSNSGEQFLIGMLNNGEDSGFVYINDTLGFNLWHKYPGTDIIGGKHYPKGWTANDSLFSTTYTGQVQGILTNIQGHNMRTLMQRPKIEYLCYGQRSDYQCEDSSNIVNKNYWFYTFQSNDPSHTHTGDNWQDNSVWGGNNVWVKRCRLNIDDAGYVVDRLRSNTEQCHRATDNEAYRWDSECDWYIKPRIRIDSNFVNNSNNWGKLVCRVDIYNHDGHIPNEPEINKLKSIDIRVRNFKPHMDSLYLGYYLEEFYFQYWQDTSSQIIHGDWATGNDQWWFTARGSRRTDTDNNKADIHVYWYGNCDMWIDYVRVDNDIADGLLNPNSVYHARDSLWLQWEAQDIALYNSSPYQFYIELFEFNQIPCMSYVSKKIDSITSLQGKHFNVMADMLCFYQNHLSMDERGIIDTPEKVKSMCLDSIGSKQIFLGDPYPLIAPSECFYSTVSFKSQIPSTLNTTSWGSILATDVTDPPVYDKWLQGQFDTVCTFYKGGGWIDENFIAGVYLYLMKQGDAISKLSNIPFIPMIQTHQWIGGGEVDREPTNEEIDMMTNLALSYGAKGIIYWGYGTWSEGGCKYSYGIMNSSTGTPRYENVYGQPKWEHFKQLTGRLKTIGPYFMSFDTNRHSYIYRLESERSALKQNSYFRDIITYKPGEVNPGCEDNPENWDIPEGLIFECNSERYIQAATFITSPSDINKYFMIVNRRCAPYRPDISENGGRRYIKIGFDPYSTEFSHYTNWKVTEIGSNEVEFTFDKRYGGPIELGWFMPGEGKLYKISPVP